MRPIFNITINRQELREAVKDRVLEITIEDSAGYQNDNCIIKLDGRRPFPKIPASGAIVEVSFGYGEMENVKTQIPLTKMGIYELAEIDWDGPPWGMVLTCNALSMLKFPKTARNDEHQDTTLKEIVEKCANRMGYEPDVHPKFADIEIKYEAQKNVTDMEFINLLAQRYGAFPKIFNQRLRFYPKDGSSFVGQELKVDQCFPGSIHYHSQVRSVYGEIQAATFSYDTGKLQRISVDSNVPELGDAGNGATMELSRLYADAETARAAAQSKRDFLASEEDSLAFKIGGHPLFQSHRKLFLSTESDWHPDIPAKWIVVSSTHRWSKGDGDNNGYTTEVKCEIQKEGKEDDDNAANDAPTDPDLDAG